MMYHCSQLAIAIQGEQWLDTEKNNYSNNTIKILSRINCYRTISIYLFMDNFSHLKIIYFALLINGIQGRTRYHQNKSQRCQGRFSSKDNKLLREGWCNKHSTSKCVRKVNFLKIHLWVKRKGYIYPVRFLWSSLKNKDLFLGKELYLIFHANASEFSHEFYKQPNGKMKNLILWVF